MCAGCEFGWQCFLVPAGKGSGRWITHCVTALLFLYTCVITVCPICSRFTELNLILYTSSHYDHSLRRDAPESSSFRQRDVKLFIFFLPHHATFCAIHPTPPQIAPSPLYICWQHGCCSTTLARRKLAASGFRCTIMSCSDRGTCGHTSQCCRYK